MWQQREGTLTPSASLCWWGLWVAGCETTGHPRDSTQVSLGNSARLWQKGGGQVLAGGARSRQFSKAGFVLVLDRNSSLWAGGAGDWSRPQGVRCSAFSSQPGPGNLAQTQHQHTTGGSKPWERDRKLLTILAESLTALQKAPAWDSRWSRAPAKPLGSLLTRSSFKSLCCLIFKDFPTGGPYNSYNNLPCSYVQFWL